MLIFLYGSDGYRIKENVDTIVGAYYKKHKSGMSYYRFDLANVGDYDEILNSIKSVSFFDETKLIVLRNSFLAEPTFSSQINKLAADLKISSDSKTVLVFVENKGEKELQKTDKNLFAFLTAKPNLVRTISYLEGTKLSNWVRGKFKENGQSISSPVVGLLIDMVGHESWALANEISKLSNYKKGGIITEKDLNLLVSRQEDPNIFELTDAVGNQNKAKAFELMYRLTNSGHDSHYLLSMLVYHFENLLSVYDLMETNISCPVRSSRSGGPERTRDFIASATSFGMHPFVARKAASQAKKFSKGDLIWKFNHLAGLDIASKSGQASLEDSLYNFVLS